MILLWSATEKSDTLFWATLWRFGENVLSLLSKISRRLAQRATSILIALNRTQPRVAAGAFFWIGSFLAAFSFFYAAEKPENYITGAQKGSVCSRMIY
ncbi:MAG TPA: hypothetical protein VHX68_19335 [Planctomycetaceae bacterium]|jgi:hypothetical protein|nr:hypothetical protein [Planctomycetaceae bacterium]